MVRGKLVVHLKPLVLVLVKIQYMDDDEDDEDDDLHGFEIADF